MTRRLSHALGEQRLPERVVDLVRAGVRQVFALEKDARGGFRQRCAQPRGFVDRRGPAHVVRKQAIELRQERGVLPRLEIRTLQLFDGRDERFRDELAAVLAVVARARSDRAGQIVCQSCSASKNVRNRFGSLIAWGRFHARRDVDAVRAARIEQPA